MARINAKRKEFAQTNPGNTVNSQRYHVEEVEERFSKYKPGVVSKELLDALGIATNMLPPFIYRMRELGYPPGWLKEAETENSGLMLYDGKMCSLVSSLLRTPDLQLCAVAVS
ncbi:zinc finger CCHC domain-containing protein 8 isoform X1 [Silurus asotus]|uniref:Zinc finger CCHC domain-containing protein 8 isoform X1 n=1 Tax=Silurus asotus TaxID=30991 RepID=A0AAD5FKP3_SILAS|nr:zinc finger CCHC domain-containing protein 8 isoform X1 [Silurus asotus]